MEYTLPRNIIIVTSYRPTNVITARQIKDDSGTFTQYSTLFVKIVIFHGHITCLVAVAFGTDDLIIINILQLRVNYYKKENSNWVVFETSCSSTPLCQKAVMRFAYFTHPRFQLVPGVSKNGTWIHNYTRSLTLRSLTLYIYGAPILDVSRSHTSTQHSR